MTFAEVFAWGFALGLCLYFIGFAFWWSLDLFTDSASDDLSWSRSNDD